MFRITSSALRTMDTEEATILVSSGIPLIVRTNVQYTRVTGRSKIVRIKRTVNQRLARAHSPRASPNRVKQNITCAHSAIYAEI